MGTTMNAEQAANTMHQLTLVYGELAYKIKNAPDFKSAARLYQSAWRSARTIFAKLGDYATPDMIRITKNTFDAVTVRAAADSPNPKDFLMYSMQSAETRNERWQKEIFMKGDKSSTPPSKAIKTSQRVVLPDGTEGIVTGVALGGDGEALVRVRAVKATVKYPRANQLGRAVVIAGRVAGSVSNQAEKLQPPNYTADKQQYQTELGRVREELNRLRNPIANAQSGIEEEVRAAYQLRGAIDPTRIQELNDILIKLLRVIELAEREPDRLRIAAIVPIANAAVSMAARTKKVIEYTLIDGLVADHEYLDNRRNRSTKAINWRSTLQALVPLVATAIASAKQGVFTAKEERILKSASAMLKRAAAGVGAGLPKEAAEFARTAQQAADGAARYGKLAALPDELHKPGEKETWLRTYAHQAGAVMTYLKEAINAIPATTRSVKATVDRLLPEKIGAVHSAVNEAFIDQQRAMSMGRDNLNQTTAMVNNQLRKAIGLINNLPDSPIDTAKWALQINHIMGMQYAAARPRLSAISDLLGDIGRGQIMAWRLLGKIKSADVIVLAASEVKANIPNIHEIAQVSVSSGNEAARQLKELEAIMRSGRTQDWGQAIKRNEWAIANRLGQVNQLKGTVDGDLRESLGYMAEELQWALKHYNRAPMVISPRWLTQVAKSLDGIFMAARRIKGQLAKASSRSVKADDSQLVAQQVADAKRMLAGGKSVSTKTPSTRVGSVVVKNELGFMPHPDTSGDWFFNIDGVENRIYGRYAEALRKAVMIAKRDLLTEITVTGVRRDYGQ